MSEVKEEAEVESKARCETLVGVGWSKALSESRHKRDYNLDQQAQFQNYTYSLKPLERSSMREREDSRPQDMPDSSPGLPKLLEMLIGAGILFVMVRTDERAVLWSKLRCGSSTSRCLCW